MNLKEIDHHTIDVDMLAPGCLVLDVGCHGWTFAATLAAKGCFVYALDPAPDVEDLSISFVKFRRLALVGIGQDALNASLVQVRDRDGWHLETDGTPNVNGNPTISVATIDIKTLMRKEGVDHWSVVKLNCEGAEVDILKTWPGPIADQIVVSFHKHTDALKPGDMEMVQSHLAQWYDCVQNPYDERFGAGWNYWDSLFVLREA